MLPSPQPPQDAGSSEVEPLEPQLETPIHDGTPPPPPAEVTDGFTPIEELGEGESPKPGLEQTVADLDAYTEEEILEALQLPVLLAIGVETEAEVAAFQEAVQWVHYPMLKTAKVLAPLKVGQALKKYGLAKGAVPGMGAASNLPEWARLLIGGVAVGAAMYGGIRAARETRAEVRNLRQEAPVGNHPGRGAGPVAGDAPAQGR